MVTPYLPTLTCSMWLALPVQVLPSARCQSLSAASGTGSQARETPWGLEISARVVTSKLRHAGSARRRRQGKAAATRVAPRKSRLFMVGEASGRRFGPQGCWARAATSRYAGRHDDD